VLSSTKDWLLQDPVFYSLVDKNFLLTDATQHKILLTIATCLVMEVSMQINSDFFIFLCIGEVISL
jgi:hypothetical protein